MIIRKFDDGTGVDGSDGSETTGATSVDAPYAPPQATAPVVLWPIDQPSRPVDPATTVDPPIQSPTIDNPNIGDAVPSQPPVTGGTLRPSGPSDVTPSIPVNGPGDPIVILPVVSSLHPSGPTDTNGSIPSDTSGSIFVPAYEPIYSANSIQFPVRILVGGIPIGTSKRYFVNVKVQPEIPKFDAKMVNIPTSLRLVPIPLNLYSVTMDIARGLLDGKVEQFFDEDREGKTLLNFGSDFQTVITNWIKDPTDDTNTSLLVKLYRALPDAVEEKTQAWIARELASPIIDRLFVTYTPPAAAKVYLRPPNRNVKLLGQSGTGVSKVKMGDLLTKNAFNPIKVTDPTLEEWFTHDVNASELNVNYADYREFVFFGSAQSRLNAFVNKLTTIESLNATIAKQSSSLASSGQIITGSLPYPVIQRYSDERLELIRSFDPYERFMYYSTGAPYSASLSTTDDGDAWYVNADATFPKSGGSVLSVSSSTAQTWITAQSAIATAYDIQNQNSLANNLPAYLKNDANSAEFITFVNMVGHQFDTLKVYTEHMSYIYDRDSDPSKGMSPDLVWNIANSFGVKLPNQYAVSKLVDYTIGGSGSAKVYREVAAETWKRFLHNQIFLMKTKGTKASLRALANTYGILPTMLQIKESTTVGPESAPNFETYDEQTNALNFSNTSSNGVQVPWNSLPGLPKTVEIRFAAVIPSASILASSDNTWALTLTPTTGSYGTVGVFHRTLGTTIVSSSVFPIFSGDFYSTMLRYEADGITLHVARADGNDIIETSKTKESGTTIAAAFTSQAFLNIGGSGSAFVGKPGFRGLVDEVRVWGETLSDATFQTHTKYAGLYNGETSTSARDNLFVRLSFNKTMNLFATSSLPNETPYLNSHPTPSLNNIATFGFPNIPTAPNNMSVITRSVTRFTPNAASNFTTNKVIIGDAPVYTYREVTPGTFVPILTRDFSIKTVGDKQSTGHATNTVGFYFSVTNAINDNIIRSIGNIDLQNLIGDPSDLGKTNYSTLQTLNDLYWNSYAYSYNVNSFVDFVDDLLDPLFAQAKSLVPARAKLLSGIVHEPHILERAKIVQRPIVFDGDLTLVATPVTSKPDNVLSFYDQFRGTVSVKNEVVTAGETEFFTGTLDQKDLTKFVAVAGHNYSGSLDLDTTARIVGLQMQYEGVVQSMDTRLSIVTDTPMYGLDAFGGGGLINIKSVSQKATLSSPPTAIDTSITPIGPLTDFSNIESYTYFSTLGSLVAVPVTVPVRVNAGILNNRGTWKKNTTYTRNDYVVQLDPSPEAGSGYNKEYVCISPAQTFYSLLPPSLDRQNWKQMAYVSMNTVQLKTAALINGAVSLLPSGSQGFPLATGYQPTHYKFTRDRRRGILNHQWLGCVQTDLTTSDGLPAVEISTTTGEALFVHNDGAPVVPTNNPSGPILDVL